MTAAGRGYARRATLALLLSLSAAPWATQALAQGGPATQPQAQEDRPRRRPPQASSAPAAATDLGARRRATAPSPSRLQPHSPPVLSSAVHARYSLSATIARSTGGQCRAQCAEARSQCFNADSLDTSGCDPGWTRCLSSCEGLTYSRRP